MRHQVCLYSHLNDIPDRTPLASQTRKEKVGILPVPTLPLLHPSPTETASASGAVEAKMAAVEEPRPKYQKVKCTARARSRAKPKSF